MIGDILIWTSIALGIILFIFFSIGLFAYLIVFVRGKDVDLNKIKEGHPVFEMKEQINKTYSYLKNLKSEEYVLTNKRNHKVYATLFRLKQEREKPIVVVFNHGWRGNGMADFSFTDCWTLKQGYDLFIPVHEGHGKSEGKFTSFGMRDYQDLKMWIEKVNELYNHNCDIILYGVSMGGHIVLQASSDDLENVRLIIEDSGYADTYRELEGQMKKVSKLFGGIALTICGFLAKLINKLDIKKIDTRNNVKNSKYPILFIHGTADEIVYPYMAQELYDSCGSEKDILIVEGATHIKSYLTNEKVYLDKCLEFIKKHI